MKALNDYKTYVCAIVFVLISLAVNRGWITAEQARSLTTFWVAEP